MMIQARESGDAPIAPGAQRPSATARSGAKLSFGGRPAPRNKFRPHWRDQTEFGNEAETNGQSPMPRPEIESLYRVFSRYPRPKQLEGCPCCTSPTEGEGLLRKALRALSASELAHYALQALTTWGTLEDFKYFLPRLLELTDDDSLLCDAEITFGKLEYGGFPDWPTAEREAVTNFIIGAWREAMCDSDLDRADSLLCGVSRVLEDVSSLLTIADVVAPEFRFNYMFQRSNQTKRKLLNCFWDDSTPNYQRVLSWLYPTATGGRDAPPRPDSEGQR
jgi:hypothetical protein